MGVLPLMKKEARIATYDLDPKEVVQSTQILESELSTKSVGELS